MIRYLKKLWKEAQRRDRKRSTIRFRNDGSAENSASKWARAASSSLKIGSVKFMQKH